MNKWILTLLISFIPFLSFAQWYDLPNVPTGRCHAIDAYDSLIATGPYKNDSLYLTTDGGNYWFSRALPANLSISDISIEGSEKIWFCTYDGKIYYSNDSGFNWQIQFDDTSKTKFMNYLEMFDEMNGMAMGDAPANDKPALFLKTTNGGQDWISQNQLALIGLASGDLWRKVDFVDINTGYFFSSGETPQKLYKTTNSGANWTVINDSLYFMVLKSYDENILVGEEAGFPPNGTIHKTVDGGQTWESQQWNFLDWALDIEFLPGDPSNVWCGSNSLSFSSDTGRTLVEEFYLEYNAIYDMVFTDENSGWIYAGGGGTLTHMYRTTNGGHGGIVSVDNNYQDLKPSEFKLEQNYPNPFNPSTKIKFTIPSVYAIRQLPEKQSQMVTLKVYDVLGNEIATLVNEELSPGEYKVEFTVGQDSSPDIASGIYFYTLRAGSFVQTKKMILLK
jgi:photosystem II stability/assembly factor-like uncharacterized protein